MMVVSVRSVVSRLVLLLVLFCASEIVLVSGSGSNSTLFNITSHEEEPFYMELPDTYGNALAEALLLEAQVIYDTGISETCLANQETCEAVVWVTVDGDDDDRRRKTREVLRERRLLRRLVSREERQEELIPATPTTSYLRKANGAQQQTQEQEEEQETETESQVETEQAGRREEQGGEEETTRRELNLSCTRPCRARHLCRYAKSKCRRRRRHRRAQQGQGQGQRRHLSDEDDDDDEQEDSDDSEEDAKEEQMTISLMEYLEIQWELSYEDICDDLEELPDGTEVDEEQCEDLARHMVFGGEFDL